MHWRIVSSAGSIRLALEVSCATEVVELRPECRVVVEREGAVKALEL